MPMRTSWRRVKLPLSTPVLAAPYEDVAANSKIEPI